jgi:putative oxidoreductase
MFGKTFDKLAGWAPLPIRIGLGIVFLAHGSQKLFGAFGGHGFQGVVGMVGGLGLKPAVFWAILVVFAEFGCGLLVLLGGLTRFAAAVIAIDMLVAIGAVHAKNGFFGSAGGFEYPFSLVTMCLSLILSGAGALSVDGLFRRRSGS